MRQWTLLMILAWIVCQSCVSPNGEHSRVPGPNKEELAGRAGLINEAQALLKEGDLVLRLNLDPASQYIRNFNRGDKIYSHAGIALFENGSPYIFHILDGIDNPSGRIRKDPVGLYSSPGKNAALGIFRYDLLEQERKSLRQLIYSWDSAGVRFDKAFNLMTDDQMYCSEMVSKALQTATHNRIRIETTRPTAIEAKLFSAYLGVPLTHPGQRVVVSIDNLYLNPHCRLIKEVNFKRVKS